MAPVRDVVRQLGGQWVAIGTVMPAQGGQHYDTHGGKDVTVEVELHPSGATITCRIGSAAGGPDQGVWGVPEPGDEVAVLIPDGEIDAGGIVVATLSSGGAPDRAAPKTVLVKADKVIVQAGQVLVLSDDVQLGGEALQALLDGVVTARGVDSFTGLTYGQLGSASSVVKARKG